MTTTRQDLLDELRDCELLATFPCESLPLLADEIDLLGIPGGRVLFHRGEEGDGLYIVLRGRLRSLDAAGRTLGEASPGGYVGEMALLTGAPRSATVVAVRDSTLARLSCRGFERLVAACPSAALSMARTVASRAQSNLARATSSETFSTLCLVSDANDAAAVAFGRRLVEDLSRLAVTTEVGMTDLPDPRRRELETRDAEGLSGATDTSTPMEADDAAWFDRIENRGGFVLYRCHPTERAWTRLCLRRADLVLAAACPRDLSPADACSPGARGAMLAPTDLVLLHEGQVAAGIAETARRERGFRRVLHVRRGSDADAARVVRLLTGRATGLALSGGGRRGAAHVGTLKALQEAAIDIDIVAGTSAGAIVGAMAALQFDWREALEHVHRLGRMRAWRDLGPPIIALLSGRSLGGTLRDAFGKVALGDTPLPFLPVCSAVESGEVFVPESGPLWLAVRASASLPGIFPPVPWQDRLLVDGALLNNLPADLLRARCPGGLLIASDVGAPTLRTDVPAELHSMSGWKLLGSRWRASRDAYRPSLVDLLVNAACAAGTRQFAEVRDRIDCYIAPDIADHAQMSRRGGTDIEVLVERGYQAARRAIAEVRDAGTCRDPNDAPPL